MAINDLVRQSAKFKDIKLLYHFVPIDSIQLTKETIVFSVNSYKNEESFLSGSASLNEEKFKIGLHKFREKTLEELVDILEAEVKELVKDRKDWRTKEEDGENEVNKEKRIAELKQKLEEKDTSLLVVSNEVGKREEKIKALQKEIEKHLQSSEEIKELQEKNISLENKMVELQKEIDNLNTEIEELIKLEKTPYPELSLKFSDKKIGSVVIENGIVVKYKK